MNNEKLGIPALLSYFIFGLEQLSKNHFGKLFLFFIVLAGSLYLVYTLLFTKNKQYVDGVIHLVCIFPVVIWFWSINDAYNSNAGLGNDVDKINEIIKVIEKEK